MRSLDDRIEALRAELSGLHGPPIEPIAPLPVLTDQPFAPAAVLVAIVGHAAPTILLTERRATMRAHAGEIAFPGGRLDPGETPRAAALREAHEEVALDPAHVDVLGTLPPVLVGTGFIVTPIVARIAPGLPLAPAEAEVARLFEADLAHVCDPANQHLHTGEFKGALRSFYVIDWQGTRIWGATARILVELGKRLL